MSRIIFGINFDDRRDLIYNGIYYEFEGKRHTINSGDVTIDFIDFIKFCNDKNIEHIISSSTFDSFFMNDKEDKFHFVENFPVTKEINNLEELKTYYLEKQEKK